MKNKYIDEILNDSKNIYYAHSKKESSNRELLLSHLELTYSYYEKMEKYKNLDTKVISMILKIFNVSLELAKEIYELFKAAIYYHDIGKINPLFQKNKMQNDLKLEAENNDSLHAALSARIYIEYMLKLMNEKINDMDERIVIYYAIFCFGYIISRHHTSLESINELKSAIKDRKVPQISDFDDQKCEMLDQIEKFIERANPDPIGIYILCKILYSCLVTADFYATYEFMTGNKVPVDVEKDSELFREYTDSELYKKIREYQKDKGILQGINKLRSDMFLETEKTLMENLDSNIFYIEAPTGAGKTNIAINVAKTLYENDKDIKSVQYIFPFNNIIEQTAETFERYFKKYKDFMVINSSSSMVSDNDENLDYEKVYIKNAFRQFPIVITSHVNIFDSLFGNGKEENYSLYHLIDSVIVIDEIQSYSNGIWREIIECLSKYSSFLNIKFVIMSATLPRLDRLLKTDKKHVKFCSLIEDSQKYYQNDIFKNRVSLNFDLLESKIDKEKLINEILKHKDKKVLAEFIKKDTADEVYNMLCDLNLNVQILTGDDNKLRRTKIIKMAKEDNPIIIVATQTIEAGVDIDMDIGFKDISFIDSEEQFLGRINRASTKKECIAYFFDLDDARGIYPNDNRLEYSLKRDDVKVWLKDKSFDRFYEKLMDKIYDKTEKYNNDNIEKFYNNCSNIDFKAVQRKMELIKNDMIQIFLNYNIEFDGQNLSGKEIFGEYKALCMDDSLSYAEKKIKLSKISEKLNLFIYNLYKDKIKIVDGEQFGGFYYVDDGEKYIENGRFNKKKYLEKGEELFL